MMQSLSDSAALRDMSSANRVVIVIDKEGVVQHRWVAENPGVEPDYEAIVALAESL